MKFEKQLQVALFLALFTTTAFSAPAPVQAPVKTPPITSKTPTPVPTKIPPGTVKTPTPAPSKTPTPKASPSDVCTQAGQPGQNLCRIYSGKKLDGSMVTNEVQCCFANELCDPTPKFASRCYLNSETVCPIGRLNDKGALQGMACSSKSYCYQPTVNNVVKNYCVTKTETPCSFMGDRLKTCTAAGRCSKLFNECVMPSSTEDGTKLYINGQTWTKNASGQPVCVAGCKAGVANPFVPGGMAIPL